MGKYYALDGGDEPKWTFVDSETTMFAHGPAIARDGTTYIVGAKGKGLIAVNPDGTKKWVFPTEDSFGCAPFIDGNAAIYICDGAFKGTVDPFDDTNQYGQSFLYAIYPDGSLKWKFEFDERIMSAILADDDLIYVTSAAGTLFAIGDAEGV